MKGQPGPIGCRERNSAATQQSRPWWQLSVTQEPKEPGRGKHELRGRAKREEIEKRVYVALHDHAAEQAQGEEKEGELLGLQRKTCGRTISNENIQVAG